MFQLHQARTQRIIRLLIYLFSSALIFLLTRREVKGVDGVPEHGPLLIVANHISMADQYFIDVSLKRRIRYMAKEELFRYWPLRLLVESFGAFPVRRGGADRRALDNAYRVLDSGMALFMFPEGTRSKDARLRPSLSGSALIALHNSVPILPVGITGLENLGKGLIWYLFHRPRVTVNIGRPFYLKHVDDKLSRKQLAELAGDIMEHIAELLPPRYQGHYTGRIDSNGTED